MMKRNLEKSLNLSYLFMLSGTSTRRFNLWMQNQLSKLDKSPEFELMRHAHNGKLMYSLSLTRIYILITWCFIF